MGEKLTKMDRGLFETLAVDEETAADGGAGESTAEEIAGGAVEALTEESEEEKKAREAAEKEAKRQETIAKVKKFLWDNKDALILSGQLALVAIVCIAGIRNDITPDCCKKKKRRKKRR